MNPRCRNVRKSSPMLKKNASILFFSLTLLLVSCSPRTGESHDRTLTVSLGTRITTLDPALAAILEGKTPEEQAILIQQYNEQLAQQQQQAGQ